MKKIIILSVGISLLASYALKADEGMWMLTLLNKNYAEMQEQGLKLSPDDIYNINKSSLKDAIVIFGGYCTGEIVSDQGLLFTNHHCGYSSIQQHSSLQNDYLKDGFWAESFDEEIPTPGLYVDFLQRIEDVTDRINSKINYEMNEADRRSAIIKERDLIIKEVAAGNNFYARVQSFFGGNNYYLLVYESYNDVRMVGAPPSSIGRFGHETDNWIWPRHTSDFCIFRVYMSPDSSAAEYSENNIPLVPKYSLPISIKGYDKGDFAMILGYPGSTTRYMTSYELQQEMEINNKNVEKIAGTWLEIVEKDMKADDKVRIQYASKQSSISNYWKMCIEQNKALLNLNVLEQKQKIEDDFSHWESSDKNRKIKYGKTLSSIQDACISRKEAYNVYQYYSFCMRGSELLRFAQRANGLYEKLMNKSSDEDIKKEAQILEAQGKVFYKNYNPPTDLKSITALLELYYNEIPSEFHPAFYREIDGYFEKFTKKMFNTSIFSSQERFEKFIKNPKLKVLKKDLGYATAMSFSNIPTKIMPSLRESQTILNKGNRQFIEGLNEMDDTKNYYPDANGTMRLSYGTIGDYKPRDAVFYDYYTTMTGLMEKDTPGNMEFEVDDKIKELYNNKDFGRYGDGNIVMCFTTNNDISGGNSGSPVINGSGELIGLAFDGNSEAMSGDISFDPNMQKCINADIRYVLFIIEKYAGASRLIEEMDIRD